MVGKLLPWYQYQLDLNGTSEMDDEIRDFHELSTALARYLPITDTSQAVYSHLALKVSHEVYHSFLTLIHSFSAIVSSP